MQDCLIISVCLLGYFALSAYIACMSNRANNVKHFEEKMDTEDRMIFRMEDYVAQKNLATVRPTRAKAA